MKKYLLTIIIISVLTAAVSADTIRATVNGMVCGFCATGIEKTFRAQPEVKAVECRSGKQAGHDSDKARPDTGRLENQEIARQRGLLGRRCCATEIMNVRTIILEILTILSSFSTSRCCALPAALVSIGAGAALASVLTAVPQLVWLSEHNIPLFAFARTHVGAVGRFGLSQPRRALSRRSHAGKILSATTALVGTHFLFLRGVIRHRLFFCVRALSSCLKSPMLAPSRILHC